jgi:predicted nucleotidyltransferase
MTADPLVLPAEVRAKLDEAVRRIVEAAQPRLVILFGSYAEGREAEKSDVDLLIVADTDSRVQLGAELREALEPVFAPTLFDLVLCTPAGWEKGRHLRGFAAREADRKGVRLYQA